MSLFWFQVLQLLTELLQCYGMCIPLFQYLKNSSSNYYNLSTMILCIEYQNFVLWSCFEGLAVFDLENVLESKKELKTIWNLTLKSGPIYNTWQFHCRQHWDLIPLSKTVSFTKWFQNCIVKLHLHICKWYLIINASLTDAKQMLWHRLPPFQ